MFPMLCPVLLRFLGLGVIQAATGKGDTDQLVLKEYSVISGIHSAQTTLHYGDHSSETGFQAAGNTPFNLMDMER